MKTQRHLLTKGLIRTTDLRHFVDIDAFAVVGSLWLRLWL